MNRELLEAFGALAVTLHDDIHRCYPALLRATEPREISDEALVAWRLLLALEELFVLVDEVEKRCLEQPHAGEVTLLLPF